MEQVNFDPLASLLLDNNEQTLLLQNNFRSVNVNFNSDVVGVFNAPSSSVLNNSVNISTDNSLPNGNYYLIKKEPNDNVVELSISEDYSVQLMQTSPSKKEMGNVIKTSNDKIIYENSSDRKLENNLALGSLNDLLQLPTSQNEDLKERYELIASNVKDNVEYAAQLESDLNMEEAHDMTTNVKAISSECINGNTGSVINVTDSSSTPIILTGVSANKLDSKPIFNVTCNKWLPGTKVIILSNVKFPSTASPEHKKLQEKPQRSSHKSKSFLNSLRTIASQRFVNSLNSNGIKTKENQEVTELKLKNSKVSIPGIVQSSALNNANIVNVGTSLNCNRMNVPQNVVLTTLHSAIPFSAVPIKTQLDPRTYVSQAQAATASVATQRITPVQLKKIAAFLQNSQSSRSQPSTFYDSDTDTKLNCRMLHPEDLIFKRLKKKKKCPPRKGGRRKKKVDDDKESKEMFSKKIEEKVRTRSGRVSRPPKYLQSREGIMSDLDSEKDENIENSVSLKLSLYEPHKKDKNFSKFTCPTCRKVYLGKVKMAIHFDKYPSHGGRTFLDSLDNHKVTRVEKEKALKKLEVEKRKLMNNANLENLKAVLSEASDGDLLKMVGERVACSLPLHEYLVARMKKEGGIKRFIEEDLTTLLGRLEELAPFILRPSESTQNNILIENEKLCKVLNILPGIYVAEDQGLGNVMNQLQEISPPLAPPESSSVTPDLMSESYDIDKTESILDEILSDKSSYDSMDEIVRERLKDLIPSDDLVEGLLTSVHSQALAGSLMSDSAGSEAVSASTEDLIKSFEGFADDPPPSTDFDFSVLTPSFVTDRFQTST